MSPVEVQLPVPPSPPPRRPAAESPVERLTVDDMLQKYCGEFGRWQWRNFILANLSWSLEAFNTMVVIFSDHEPHWRCVHGMDCDGAAQTVCGLKPGSWEWVEGRGSSTVAEWGLVCGDKYKVGLAQAMFFVGCMIGSGLFGYLSDSALGRKRSLVIVCLLNAIFGLLTAFSPYYWTYVLLRALTGISTGGNAVCSFVLATEPIGPTKRGAAGMSSFYFFSAGTAVLSGMAYAIRSWRKLYIASSIPSLVFLIAALPFISESPRWYLIHGKHDQALKLMKSIAKCNGKHLPEGVVLLLDREAINGQTTNGRNDEDDRRSKIEEHDENGGLSLLIRSPIARTRLFIAVVMNFVGAVAYYGLSLNVVNLKTSLYLSVALNAAAETPAYIITAAFLGKLGRKRLGIMTFWFSGSFTFIGSFIKNQGRWKVVKMVCGVLGIFGMAGNYNLMFLYLEELFPTEVRSIAIGSATLASQMGAILAPFVVVLGSSMPFLVFAGCGFVGGALVFLLPETLNKPLYDTIAGLEYGEKAARNA